MSPLTSYLAKLIGLSLVFVGAALIVRRHDMAAVADALADDSALLFVLGLIALAIGLAMVLAHNIWSGSVIPVLVTIIGWLILVKGLFLLFIPTSMVVSMFEASQFSELAYLYGGISFVLGLCLTYGGFRRSV